MPGKIKFPEGADFFKCTFGNKSFFVNGVVSGIAYGLSDTEIPPPGSYLCEQPFEHILNISDEKGIIKLIDSLEDGPSLLNQIKFFLEIEKKGIFMIFDERKIKRNGKIKLDPLYYGCNTDKCQDTGKKVFNGKIYCEECYKNLPSTDLGNTCSCRRCRRTTADRNKYNSSP